MTSTGELSSTTIAVRVERFIYKLAVREMSLMGAERTVRSKLPFVTSSSQARLCAFWTDAKASTANMLILIERPISVLFIAFICLQKYAKPVQQEARCW